jgi:prophage antirepressor-like protein
MVSASSADMQLQPQGMGYFQNGCKARVAFARKGFVKALSAKSRALRKLGHAACTCNGAKCFSNKGRIVPSLFNTGFQEHCNVFFGLQVFGSVPFSKFGVAHGYSLQSAGNSQSGFDVFLLRGLVAASQQNDGFSATLRKIDPIAWAKVNAHFGYAVSNRFSIAKVSLLGSFDSGQNSHLSSLVFQVGEPMIELLGGGNVFHALIVFHRIQQSKPLDQKPPCRYAPTVPAKNGNVGLDAHGSKAQQAASIYAAFCFRAVHMAPPMVGRVGTPARVCQLPLSWSSNPARACHPFLDEWRAGSTTCLKGAVIMADASIGASAPMSFNFDTTQVRVVMRDGQPWFVAVDVCNTLGYQNSRKAISDHLDDDERCNESLQRGGSQVLINKSGLYALVLRSRKPQARKFAKWVTAEVLPSIRTTGGYTAQPLQQLPQSSQTPSLMGRRFLVTLEDGKEFIKTLSLDDCILNPAKIPSLIRSGSLGLDRQQLAAIGKACIEQLGGGRE